MSRMGRRPRSVLIFLVVALLFASALVVCFLQWRGLHAPTSGELAQAAVRLPFTLPCAVDLRDAEPVYAAIRARDKTLLMSMAAQKRIVIVRQDTPVAILSFKGTSVISVRGKARKALICYIPSDMVPVIQRRAPK